jgi:hypothetical protein
MASVGMGFVHAMLLDMTENRDNGSTWDRERRLTESLVETTMRFDNLHEPPPLDSNDPPPPPEPPSGGISILMAEAFDAIQRIIPAR